MLTRRERFDLALPFMERALVTTRDVYGLRHRETAFALHDLGVVLALVDQDNRSPRAELLFRGARDLRSRLLGEEHGETAASAAQLAWQLLLGARDDAWEPARASRLREAEHLALQARRVLDAGDDSSYRLQVRRIALEAAMALGEFDIAAARARELLAEGDYDPGPGLYPDATAFDLLLRALRAQDRDTEADALEAERHPAPEPHRPMSMLNLGMCCQCRRRDVELGHEMLEVRQETDTSRPSTIAPAYRATSCSTYTSPPRIGIFV